MRLLWQFGAATNYITVIFVLLFYSFGGAKNLLTAVRFNHYYYIFIVALCTVVPICVTVF